MPQKTITNTPPLLPRAITNRNESTRINMNQHAPLRTSRSNANRV